MFAILKNTIYTLFILIFVACSDTSSLSSYYSCTDCLSYNPDSSELTIKLTINAQNQTVPIYIYKGKYTLTDSLNIDTIVYATIPNYVVSMPVNRYYTTIAKYIKNGKNIYVIDGGDFITKNIQDYCSVDCWKTLGGTLDVKLK